MRYEPEHKANTHKRIVEDAARRFRSEGFSGASVATIMHGTGLTHGGFYKHFPSKTTCWPNRSANRSSRLQAGLWR